MVIISSLSFVMVNITLPPAPDISSSLFQTRKELVPHWWCQFSWPETTTLAVEMQRTGSRISTGSKPPPNSFAWKRGGLQVDQILKPAPGSRWYKGGIWNPPDAQEPNSVVASCTWTSGEKKTRSSSGRKSFYRLPHLTLNTQESIWEQNYRYQKAKRSWLMHQCGLHQMDLIEATFLRVRLKFQSYSCIQYTLDTTHPLTHEQTHTYKHRWWQAVGSGHDFIIETGSRGRDCHMNSLSLTGMISKTACWNSFQDVLEDFLQFNVWLWFTVFTFRLSPQSGFGHPATAVHENAGSRHQRRFRDYSSQEHEITLWQIQLAWQDTKVPHPFTFCSQSDCL